MVGFDEFFVNLQASSLIRRAYVSARVFNDGGMNLAKFVPLDGGSHQAAPPQADVALVSRTLRSNRFSRTSRNFRVSMCSPTPLIWMGRCITDAWTINRGWHACRRACVLDRSRSDRVGSRKGEKSIEHYGWLLSRGSPLALHRGRTVSYRHERCRLIGLNKGGHHGTTTRR